MRYRLRTLLIVLALGPPLIAAGWWGWSKYAEYRQRQRWRSVLHTLKVDGGGIRQIQAAPTDPTTPLGPKADLDLNFTSGQFDHDGRRYPYYPDE